jgi:hypothetical protein
MKLRKVDGARRVQARNQSPRRAPIVPSDEPAATAVQDQDRRLFDGPLMSLCFCYRVQALAIPRCWNVSDEIEM